MWITGSLSAKFVKISFSETYDRKDKFVPYRKFSPLEESVLVDSESMSVECYCRSGNHCWIYGSYPTGDKIALESIKFSGAIDLLYEGVVFDIGLIFQM
ncbi:MAG: hypothetical protein Kow00121_59590 [Elainellaceae cyanobacterium]